MKQLIILLFCLSSIFVGVDLVAQSNPKISIKYSENEVYDMIYSFKNKKSRDIWADNHLKSKFKSDFTQAKDIEWEKIDDVYEVEFEIGHTDYKAYYDKTAELIIYGYEIQLSELPAIVKNAAITKYPDYDFEDIKAIHLNSGIVYQIELEKKDREIYLLISQRGKIVKEWHGK